MQIFPLQNYCRLNIGCRKHILNECQKLCIICIACKFEVYFYLDLSAMHKVFDTCPVPTYNQHLV